MKKVLRSLKPLPFAFIRSAFLRVQRARPKSSFVRARFAPTACPQAGASAERPAEAKPALAPASRARTARQDAVSSPRRHPTQPLRGPTWHKWLKAAAWTLAFLQPPSAAGDIKFLTVRDLITPSRSTTLRT